MNEDMCLVQFGDELDDSDLLLNLAAKIKAQRWGLGDVEWGTAEYDKLVHAAAVGVAQAAMDFDLLENTDFLRWANAAYLDNITDDDGTIVGYRLFQPDDSRNPRNDE